MEYMIYKSDELTHHGIKGMKWGIRRYQNKDGSLTKAGLKRRAKLESELKQLKPKKRQTKAEIEQGARKKTVGEMTDDELRERTNRMRIEKDYYDAQKNLAIANPVKVSAGKKFMSSLMTDVVAPAAKNAGRAWLEDFMKDKLGLNKKTELQRLEETWKKADYRKKIKDLQKGMEDDPMGDLKKEHERAKLEKEINEFKNPKKEKSSWDDLIKQQQYDKNKQDTELDDLKREIETMQKKAKLEELREEERKRRERESGDD